MKYGPFFLVLLLLSTSACQDLGFSTDRDHALSGKVFDGFTQEPVSGAVVEVSPVGDDGLNIPIASATSGADGTYRFDALEAGDVLLQTKHGAYCPESESVQLSDERTQHDLFINGSRPIAWDGAIRLDSVKVSCDDRPANYNNAYRCRLEDKQRFHPTEFLSFYFSVDYMMHYAYPSAITAQGPLVRVGFGDGHEASVHTQDLRLPRPAGSEAYHWQGSGIQVEASIPGDELRALGLMTEAHLQPRLEAWIWYNECGVGQELWEKIPLAEAFAE